MAESENAPSEDIDELAAEAAAAKAAAVATRKLERQERRKRRLDWLYNNFQRVSFFVYSVVLAILFLVGSLWTRVFILIPPGSHGVLYQPLKEGTVTDPRLIHGEGLHIIAPWNQLYIYETRLQQRLVDFFMLSDEGLALNVEVSVRFRADRDMLGFLHQDIGTEYYERLIQPEVEGHVRETLGHRPAHEIYSSAGDLIQELNHVSTLTRIQADEDAQPYVIIQEIKLVNVSLPVIVEEAIADRYRQEQLRLEYEDRVAREEKEAERKRIEAKGIADYNEIIGEEALRWRDIEATRELATSDNAKVIVLGGGGGGGGGGGDLTRTPLVFSLRTDVTPPPAAPSPQDPNAQGEPTSAGAP